MKARVFDLVIENDNRHPVIVVSPTWGLLAKFATVAAALAVKDTITVQTKWPYQIPAGHRPKDAEIFVWQKETWTKVIPEEQP